MKNEWVLPPAVSQKLQSDYPLSFLRALLRRHPFALHLVLNMTAVFLMASLCWAGDAKLVAATYSDRYHLPSCKVAQKMAPEDMITFNSPEEAVAKGLSPCKKCNPPVPKDYKKEKTNFGGKKSGDTDS